jgi:hypothetical protein
MQTAEPVPISLGGCISSPPCYSYGGQQPACLYYALLHISGIRDVWDISDVEKNQIMAGPLHRNITC